MAGTSESLLAPLTDRLGPRIEAALREYSNLPASCPKPLHEAICYSLMAPGKRLRPMLALLAAKACRGHIDNAMPVACAVEMVHAYSLIHDDLPAMDDDDLRRGRPTCHKVYGEALAILAGDALLAMAFHVIGRHVRPCNIAGDCCAALAEAAGPCHLVGGQADDMLADPEFVVPASAKSKGNGRLKAEPRTSGRLKSGPQRNGRPKSKRHAQEHLESIHARKTGAMIRVSLRLGAMTARAGPNQLRPLDEYGRYLGLAFQVTDDLLDVRGSDANMGKRVGKDAAKGKVTYPGLLGIDRSAAYAAELIDKARAALRPLDSAADELRTLASYVLERNR